MSDGIFKKLHKIVVFCIIKKGESMKTRLNKLEKNDFKKRSSVAIRELLSACEKNINSLLEETKLLLDNKFYARSFMLSYSALEELGKRLFICDYITGIVSEQEFKSSFRDHSLKIAYLHNKANLIEKSDGTVDAEIVYDKSKFSHWLIERNKSLYVDFDFESESISNPLVEINEEYAQQIYNFLLKHIEDTNRFEMISERIGSKAFYK